MEGEPASKVTKLDQDVQPNLIKGHGDGVSTKENGDTAAARESTSSASVDKPTASQGDVDDGKDADCVGFAFSSEPSLERIRQIHAKFCKDRDWDQYHQPRNLFLALVGEVGEVAELFQWKPEVKEGLPGWTEKERGALANELSDVLIYLVRLAEKCKIDLPAAAIHKIGLNGKKYPANQVYGSSKKYTEYND